MKAYLASALVFFITAAMGLWGFTVFSKPWNWLAIIAGFLIGCVASMLTFKRLASKQQIKDDLDVRLDND